jgi:hypothetical protein
MISSSPLTWTTRHVAGHQDNDPAHSLDWWALQNIQMDNLAKVFRMQHSDSAPILCSLSDEGFQVWLGNRKLSSHQPAVFFDHIHGKTILNWRSSHHRCARRIDWNACAAALKRLPLGRRRWVSKHASGFCSGGAMLVRWREEPAPACPRCDQPETARHVWQCQEPAVSLVWALLMSSCSKWLQRLHTANGIICWITQRFAEWRSSEPFSTAQSAMLGLLQAISAHDRIGGQAFLEGCIAIEWARCRKPTSSGLGDGTPASDGRRP